MLGSDIFFNGWATLGIVLQLLVTWLSVRVKIVRTLARAEPRLLLYRGQMLESAMQAERVTESEVLQAMRSQGVLALGDAEAVVLETDGTFSVVSTGDHRGRTSLAKIGGAAGGVHQPGERA
jgi:uncharacterized membrane protein YcaP (DUF421 family)